MEQRGPRFGAQKRSERRAVQKVRISGEILTVGVKHLHRALVVAADHLQLPVGKQVQRGAETLDVHLVGRRKEL